MEKKRVYLYDNVKFLLIALVVAGHFIDYGGNAYYSNEIFSKAFVFIYAFHMPLFLFISGLFYKGVDITRKIFYYFSTGILLSIVIFASQRLIYGNGTLDFLYIRGASWFMFALGAYTAIAYLVRNIDQRLVLSIAFILSVFSGYSDSLFDYLSLSRIVVFFPFFFAGTMIDPIKLEQFTRKKICRISGAVLIVVWAVLCSVIFPQINNMRKLFTGIHPFKNTPWGIAEYGWAYRLLCILISSLLCFAFISVMPSKKIRLISVDGSRTLQVYFWHITAVFLVHLIPITPVLTSNPWGGVLCILICIGITLLLSLKPFAFPTNLIKKYTFTAPNR